MTASVIVHREGLGERQLLEPKVWRERLMAQISQGHRAVTLFGRRDGERASITAVLQAPGGKLLLSRTVVSVEVGYHEMTSEYPALHCFERELHEQTGVRIAGHPWLKPVRYEGRPPSAMNDYPFYKIEGKEVHEVAVGPVHAGVIEPGSFRFMCLGEQIHHLEIQLGYQHRGLEALLLKGDPRRLAPLVETIVGDSSVAHTWAYCAALESLAGIDLDLEVEVARAVALELERIAMHLSALSGLAGDLGFLQGATTYGRLRTTAINTTMRLCGSRFGRGALRPGGVAMKDAADCAKELNANMELLRRDLAIIQDRFLASHTVQHRLRGVGALSLAQATDLGLVGPAARSSGVALDARQQMAGGAYGALPLPLTVSSTGDCWARAEVRIAEIDASLAWVSAMVSRFPTWTRPRSLIGSLAPDQAVVAVVEGWRGEVVHCIETDATGKVVHYKVQDPSLRNWLGVAIAVRENEISDFPICNKSFDLSYCGNDL